MKFGTTGRPFNYVWCEASRIVPRNRVWDGMRAAEKDAQRVFRYQVPSIAHTAKWLPGGLAKCTVRITRIK